MVILIPLLILILICFFYEYEKIYSFHNIYISVVYGICAFCAFVFITTQILSFFHQITFINLLLCYFVFICIIGIYFYCKHRAGITISQNILPFFSNDVRNKICVILFSVFVIILAIITSPNNWDSMAYHLPRILQWTQNHSVAHYATNYVQQIAVSSLPEYINLHVYILSGKSDLFFNLLQCLSFLFDGYLIFGISLQLENDKKWSYMAAVLWFVCPISFAEALTTQTDVFAALWLLSFVTLLLFIMKNKNDIFNKAGNIHFIFIGLILGFAYNTKVHTILGMIFFSLFYLIFLLKNNFSLRKIIYMAGIVFISTVFIVIPDSLKIYQTFETIFPDLGGSIMLVQTKNPKYLVMNLIKAISYNLPCNSIPASAKVANKIVTFFQEFLKVDMNAPSITWHDFCLGTPSVYNHDNVPYPMILYLFLFSILFIFFRCIKKILLKKRCNHNFLLYGYVLCSSLSYFIFLSINRFTEANVRYQIVFLSLLCPLIVTCISRIKCIRIRNFIEGTILTLLSISFINQAIYHFEIYNFSDGNREKGYFAYQQYTYDSHIKLMNAVLETNPKTIGLYIPGLFEYPIRKMLNNRGDFKYYNINVNNATEKYEADTVVPDSLIFITYESQGDRLEYNGHTYVRTFSLSDVYENYSVYVK